MSASPFPVDTATPIERVVRPFQRFAQAESSGGIVLLIATIIALVWANTPWWESYHHLWGTPLQLNIGTIQLEMTLHHFINDGLMVIFFFMVGLEIKREIMVGELASPRAAALPIAAAIGGMLIPASLYALVNVGGIGAAGWGIPMATDIAFALGVLALMGPRIPLGLKVFLAALAIVDDLGAVLVIALFYTAEVNVAALGIGAVVVLGLIGLNVLGVRNLLVYTLFGLVLWGAFLASGVHATIAGVLLAMTIPARTRLNTHQFVEVGQGYLNDFKETAGQGSNVMTNHDQQVAIHGLEKSCEAAQTPLLRMEHGVHYWVAFLIIPIFALSNAGVHLNVDLGSAISHPVTLGIILGLVIGKPLGITVLAWAAVRMGLASLPHGVTWGQIHGVSWLGGIGFTMSLFVANLAFGEGSALLDAAKIGVLAASTIAAITGWILLRPRKPSSAT